MRRLAILLFGLIASLAMLGPTAAERPLSIEGRLVNGTAGGGKVDAVEVTLNSIDPDGSPQEVTSVAAGADGAFHFEDIDVDPSLAYFVSARYEGVEYWSEPISFEDDEPTATLELAVYETTEDPAGIAIELGHVAVDVVREQRLLQIVQYVVLTNEGDKTYLGGESADGGNEIRLLSLPRDATGATIVGAPMGASLAPDGLAVIGSQPILPGELEVAVTYDMTYVENSQLIAFPIDYPVRTFAFLIPDTGLDVESEHLSFETVTSTGGKDYLRMGAQDLAPGEIITVQILDLPQPGGGGGINSLAVIMIGFAAAAAVVLPYLWWQRRRRLEAFPGRGPAAGEQ